ncbi:MAG TPA: SUMF1/EgtB/PvdO family nonheme iron enzyme [Blastocatellia bacterium]|nr:SUMF1/EgtB/PvdO family nonheme iron enzyme [Blastocatellia bacterium]
MYCEKCNVEFPEGLRYCKWCGQTLVERPRASYDLQSCPSCAAPVQPGFAFCKACGAKLHRATRVDSDSLAQGAPTRPATPVHCAVCGEKVDQGAPYCKACGSPVEVSPDPFSSALLCDSCKSYSPLGSTVCRVCGAPLTQTVALTDQQAAGSTPPKGHDTLLDLDEEVPPQGNATPPGATVERTSLPAGGGLDSATWTLFTDDLTRGKQGLPVPDVPPAASHPESAAENLETGILPGSVSQQQAATSSLNKKRTTDSVEKEELSEVETPAQPLPQPAYDDLATVVDLKLEPQAHADKQTPHPPTSSLGARADSSEREVRGPVVPGGTAIFGSQMFEESAASPEEQLPNPPGPSEAAYPLTQERGAPSGSAGMQDTISSSTVDLAETRITPIPDSMKPTAEMPTVQDADATRVIDQEAPPQPWTPPAAPRPQPRVTPPPTVATQTPPAKKSVAPILAAVAAVVVVLAVAAVAGWWLLSGPAQPTPAPPQAGGTDTPPVAPTTPPPDSPPKPVSPPEGMVMVAAGTYLVGRNDGDEYARPEHKVTLPAFFIDRTEVTNAAYKEFIEATGHRAPDGWVNNSYPPGQDYWPVTGVSWQDAADYAAWAGKRLPTEEEWEAAARGSDGRIYPWGNDWKTGVANIGTKGITMVAQFPAGASPAGAVDMIGNVWEWTADEFDLYPGSTVPMPQTDPGVTYRVIRGGAFDGQKIHDGSYRGFLDGDKGEGGNKGWPKVGFRCVKDAR